MFFSIYNIITLINSNNNENAIINPYSVYSILTTYEERKEPLVAGSISLISRK